MFLKERRFEVEFGQTHHERIEELEPESVASKNNELRNSNYYENNNNLKSKDKQFK